MFRWFKDWRQRRKAARSAGPFMRGYDWAMRTMLGEGDENLTPDQIIDRCDDPFDGPNPFDKGALRAVEVFLNQQHQTR